MQERGGPSARQRAVRAALLGDVGLGRAQRAAGDMDERFKRRICAIIGSNTINAIYINSAGGGAASAAGLCTGASGAA